MGLICFPVQLPYVDKAPWQRRVTCSEIVPVPRSRSNEASPFTQYRDAPMETSSIEFTILIAMLLRASFHFDFVALLKLSTDIMK